MCKRSHHKDPLFFFLKENISNCYETPYPLIEKSATGMAILSTTGNFLHVNEAFIHFLGYKLSNVLQMNFLDILQSDNRKDFKKLLKRFIADKIYIIHFERCYVRYDSTFAWANTTIYSIFNTDALPQYVIIAIRDITEHKALEQKCVDLEKKVQKHHSAMERKNIAIEEVIACTHKEKFRIQNQIRENVDKLIMPILENLKYKAPDLDKKQIGLLDDNLKDLTSALGVTISNSRKKFTPREIDICNMINNRFSSKEIAKSLNISLPTVHKHRSNIRKKFKISNKNINLTSFLLNH